MQIGISKSFLCRHEFYDDCMASRRNHKDAGGVLIFQFSDTNKVHQLIWEDMMRITGDRLP
ncbi:hypothetical protein KP509_10G024800 [Ceratopteris richardii]|uniref:Uncharacterized protein n=1 Tax=Ceratopteris richardii TaxID=49495 RepID=A0A8T2U042_CERRI|nr:hypothetical protein KP509_10G024800 [Ceratopteris richardii]